MDAAPNFRQIRFRPQPSSLLGRVAAFVLSALFMLLAFVFSLAALAIAAIAAAGVGGWLWWKTRALRKTMRSQAARPAGDYIEGEAVRTDEPPARLSRGQ